MMEAKNNNDGDGDGVSIIASQVVRK